MAKYLVVVLLVLGLSGFGPRMGTQAVGVSSAVRHASSHATTATLPLAFEINRGQVDHRVLFQARGTGYTAFFTKTGATIAFSRGNRQTAIELAPQGGSTSSVTGTHRLSGHVNYLIGRDPSMWHTHIPTYAQVRYRNVYRGIDLRYYGRNGNLEYDWLLAAGANPSAVHMRIVGASLSVLPNGNLAMHTALGTIEQLHPAIYQMVAGHRQNLSGAFTLFGHDQIGFRLAPYNRSRPLIIDPQLLSSPWSLQGSGADYADAVATGTNGDSYLAGSTSSSDFPVCPDPSGHDPNNGGYCTAATPAPYQGVLKSTPPAFNAFVARLGAKIVSGTQTFDYITYLGGSGSDWASGIAVSDGHAYVTGSAGSTDFPTTAGVISRTNKSTGSAGNAATTVFVTELNIAGTGLVYSTFLGGAGIDRGHGIAIKRGSSGASVPVYLTGTTSSTDFPVCPGPSAACATSGAASSPSFTGSAAFVALLVSNTKGMHLTYSRLLGGSDRTLGKAIAVDPVGNAYFAGTTWAPNFPLCPGTSALCASNGHSLRALTGGTAGNTYVAELNPAGAKLVYSTALDNAPVIGFPGNYAPPSPNGAIAPHADAFDPWQHIGLAVNSTGNTYVTGASTGTGIQATAGACQTVLSSNFHTTWSDAYVSKLGTGGTSLLYTTFLGGTHAESGEGIALDPSGNAYVVGNTESTDFPLHDPLYQYKNGPDTAGTFLEDGFISKINSTGSDLLDSSYLGSDGLFATGIAIDPAGRIRVSGTALPKNSNDAGGAFLENFTPNTSLITITMPCQRAVAANGPLSFTISASDSTQDPMAISHSGICGKHPNYACIPRGLSIQRTGPDSTTGALQLAFSGTVKSPPGMYRITFLAQGSSDFKSIKTIAIEVHP